MQLPYFFTSFPPVHLPICAFSALLCIPWGTVKEMQDCAAENESLGGYLSGTAC